MPTRPRNSTPSAAFLEAANRLSGGLGESHVIGLLAPRRQGKTLTAAYLIGNAAAHTPGLKVLHNGPLKFGQEVGLQQLLEAAESEDNHLLDRALVFIDEAHTWFDPRRGMTIAEILAEHALIQAGHRSFWLLWTTQEERKISAGLRFQTDWLIEVSKAYFDNTGQYYCGHKECRGWPVRHTISGVCITQKPMGRIPPGIILPFSLHCAHRFYNLYDTNKIVGSWEAIGMTSDTIRRRKESETLRLVYSFAIELAKQGVARIKTGDFVMQYEDVTGRPLSPKEGVFYLSKIGGVKRGKNSRDTWSLEDLGKAAQDQDAAAAG